MYQLNIYNDIKILSMKRLNFYLIMIWLCSFVIFFCFSENKISGKAFSMLTETNIDDLVPELGSRITSVCLFDCLCVCVSVCLSVCLSVCHVLILEITNN